jgi:hypothetical protein
VFNFEPKFKSVRELLEQDAQSPLPSSEFDDQLWLLLSRRIQNLQDLHNIAPEIGIYYASRYLQWEVGNGGFAQAAYNIPEWFASAADGYEALGKAKSAALIRKAMKLLPAERLDLEDKGLFRATIGRVFEHFSKSRMVRLDELIDSEDWYVDSDRVEYVRSNRNSFATFE